MKTFSQFIEEVSPTRLAQLRAKGKGDAADQKMKADNLTSTNKPSNNSSALAIRKPKQLPPSSSSNKLPSASSGALVKSPADKGASIVRTKQGGTGKESVGATRKSAGPGSKTYDRIKPERAKGGPLSTKVRTTKPKSKFKMPNMPKVPNLGLKKLAKAVKPKPGSLGSSSGGDLGRSDTREYGDSRY